MTEPQEDSSSEYEFILVHGTWGNLKPPWSKKPLWHEKDSDFWKQLRASFGQGCSIRSHCWSGRNLFSERERAATKLAKTLDEPGPSMKKVIIAHSHGGSVALLAVSQMNTDIECAVVTMSSPFLHYGLRVFPGVTFRSAAVSLLSIGVFAVTLVPLLAGLSAPYIAIASTLAIAAAVVVFRPLCKRLSRFPRSLGIEPLTGVPLMILRSSRDEASMAIASSSFFGWLSEKVFKVGAAAAGFLAKTVCAALCFGLTIYFLSLLGALVLPGAFFAYSIAFIAVVVPVLIAAAVWLDLEPNDVLWFVLGAYLLSPWLLMRFLPKAFIVILTNLLSIPIWMISGVLSLGPGLDLALVSLFVSVTPETTPLGTHTVVHIDSPAGSMAHSAVYENPFVGERIKFWLLDSESKRPVEPTYTSPDLVEGPEGEPEGVRKYLIPSIVGVALFFALGFSSGARYAQARFLRDPQSHSEFVAWLDENLWLTEHDGKVSVEIDSEINPWPASREGEAVPTRSGQTRFAQWEQDALSGSNRISSLIRNEAKLEDQVREELGLRSLRRRYQADMLDLDLSVYEQANNNFLKLSLFWIGFYRFSEPRPTNSERNMLESVVGDNRDQLVHRLVLKSVRRAAVLIPKTPADVEFAQRLLSQWQYYGRSNDGDRLKETDVSRFRVVPLAPKVYEKHWGVLDPRNDHWSERPTVKEMVSRKPFWSDKQLEQIETIIEHGVVLDEMGKRLPTHDEYQDARVWVLMALREIDKAKWWSNKPFLIEFQYITIGR